MIGGWPGRRRAIHSVASGATDHAPARTPRSLSASSPGGAARVALVGPGPVDRVGGADLGGAGGDAAGGGLGGGQADRGDLGLVEHHPRDPLIRGGAVAAQMLSAATRPWYLATWVNKATQVTSPTAHRPSPAWHRSSTAIPPRPVSCTPAASRPDPAVLGVRPASGSPRRSPPGCRHPASPPPARLCGSDRDDPGADGDTLRGQCLGGQLADPRAARWSPARPSRRRTGPFRCRPRCRRPAAPGAGCRARWWPPGRSTPSPDPGPRWPGGPARIRWAITT